MLRVITHNVPAPFYWLCCDDRRCANVITSPADLSNSDDLRLSQTALLKLAGKDGWSVNLEGQLCPDHTAEMRMAMQQQRERMEQARNLVVLAQNSNLSVERATGPGSVKFPRDAAGNVVVMP